LAFREIFMPSRQPLTARRFFMVNAVFLAVLLAVLCTAPFLRLPTPVSGETGPVWTSPAELLRWWAGDHTSIGGGIVALRVPRTLLAVLAGAVLALAGVSFQAMFRNSLAEPFTLGISSTSAAGASMAFLCGWTFTVAGVPAIALSSICGAAAGTAVLYLLASGRGGMDTYRFLLGGVTLGLLAMAAIMVAYLLAPPDKLMEVFRWTMGSLQPVGGFGDILRVLPLALPGIALLAWTAPRLDLLSLDESSSAALGLDAVVVRRITFIGASLAVGAVISMTGPIGFVGLIVPHAVRLIVGPDHRLLAPAAALAGASFLVVCDLVSRSAVPGHEVPVGVVTALVGGPYFLWLLRKSAK
jgi:iron complex transport system permease protein